MKRSLYHIVYAAALSVLLCGCMGEEPGNPGAEPGFFLTVVAPDSAVKTKSDPTPDEMPGEDVFNENVINSVYYFFYPKDVTDESPAVSGFFAGLAPSDFTSNRKTWEIPVSSATVNDVLFPNPAQTCQLFVVANPPSDKVRLLEAGPTLQELRSMIIETELDGVQDDFVMVYDSLASLSSRIDQISVQAVAGMKRLASKITITVKVPASYDDNGTTWTTDYEAIKATMLNAVKKTTLAADFASASVGIKDYFETSETSFTKIAEEDGFYVCHMDIPFYSYPMVWEFTDRFEPALSIEVPMTASLYNEGGRTDVKQSSWYKLLFSEKELSQNNWYDYTITLAIMGSLFKTAPTQQYLREYYMIQNWKDAFTQSAGGHIDNNVDADIKEAQYLVLDNERFVLNNQDKVSIPFSSSHSCSFDVVRAQTEDFTTGAKVDIADATAESWFQFNGSVLEFNHPLHNELSSGLDVSPYEIEVEIYHTDNRSGFSERVAIVQYPALYVSLDENDDSAREHKGYVYVNGYNDDFDDIDATEYYRGVRAAADEGNNSSINMTIISVSQFGAGSGYVIADPRVSAIDNLSSSDWSRAFPSRYSDGAAVGASGSNRKLSYYYPTNDSDDYRSYIAPKFRVCSGNARMSYTEYLLNFIPVEQAASVSYSDAKKRCASYQEDGYPAGRWRLPTEAEVLFSIFLSNNGYIEPMFYSGMSYWCAGGTVNGTTVTRTTSGSNILRCVYDEWYWEEIDKGRWTNNTESKAFVWGDMPR